MSIQQETGRFALYYSTKRPPWTDMTHRVKPLLPSLFSATNLGISTTRIKVRVSVTFKIRVTTMGCLGLRAIVDLG
eukprot:349225-Amorphochlora_amoeboformis.AAC.1